MDTKAYEVLFDKKSDPQSDLRSRYISKYRTKIIDAGPMRYVEIYPILSTWENAAKARKKRKESSEAQRQLNERNARKRIEILFNENFSERDTFATLTFRDQVEEGDARAAVQKLVRRARAYVRRDTTTETQEIKYIYVIEGNTQANETERYHVHMVISGISREALEDLWEHGRINTRRLQPDANQFTGLSRYMTKSRRFKRRWSCSKNLRRPEPKTSDHKISRRKIERLAADTRVAGREIFERAYPGFRVVEEPEVRISDYIPGAFVYVRLRREKCETDYHEFLRNTGCRRSGTWH